MTDSTHKRNIGIGMIVNAFGTSVSRVGGLVRDMCFAHAFGTGNAIGAFLMAFTIPNLFRRLLGEGALSEAMVPQLTEKLVKSSAREAYTFASNVLTVVGFVLAAFVTVGAAVCFLAQPYIGHELASMTLLLLPYLLPYTFFVCILGVLSAILNSQRHFAMPALAPAILNLGFIVAVLWILPRFGADKMTRLRGLSVIVVALGIVQIVALIPGLRKIGFQYTFIADVKSPAIKSLWRLILPGFVGASIYQLSVLFDRLFAGWLGGYAVSSLYYGERIIYLPIGIFAVAVATACLPELSRAIAAERLDQMGAALIYSLRIVLYLTAPCVLTVMMLGEPIVALIYQRGNFDAESARNTIAALLFYAPGIPAFAALKILRSAYYSRQDTTTPVRIAAVCLLIDVVLNAVFIVPLQHRGLALTTTLSAYINVVWLGILLRRQLASVALPWTELYHSLVRMAAGLVCGAICMHYLGAVAPWQFQSAFLIQVQALLVPAAGGGLIFLLVTILTGAQEPREFLEHIRPRRNAGQ